MQQVWQIIKLCAYFIKAIFQYFSSTKVPLSNFFYAYSIKENILLKDLVADYERLKTTTFPPPEYSEIYQKIHAQAHQQVQREIAQQRQLWEREQESARHLEQQRLKEVRIEALNEIEQLKSSELNRFHQEIEQQKTDLQNSFDQLTHGWQEFEAASDRQRQYQVHVADMEVLEEKLKRLRHVNQNLDELHDQLKQRLQGLMHQREELNQKLRQMIADAFESFKQGCAQLAAAEHGEQLLVPHTAHTREGLTHYSQSLTDVIENEAYHTFKTLSEAYFVHQDFSQCTPVSIDYAPAKLKQKLAKESFNLSHFGADYIQKAVWLSTIHAWMVQMEVTVGQLLAEEEYQELWSELIEEKAKTSNQLRPVTLALFYDLTPKQLQRLKQVQGDLLLGVGALGRYSERDLDSLFMHYQNRHQLNRLPLFFLGERRDF